jgi:uncharacterized SAM-binding protein YcdF (DUF218 family)
MPAASSPRSTLRTLLYGATLGLLFGLIAKELDFASAVSFHGDRALIVLGAVLGGGVLAVLRLEALLKLLVALAAALWLAVAFTPLTHWMSQPLARRDAPEKADAVFVLASALQYDGELTTAAMSRLLRGLELMGEGWAPRLILTELPLPRPRYERPARDLMRSFHLSHEILTTGPVFDTHDEAVAVSELARKHGFERLIVVTSPGHSLRASLALETQGVRVISVPSVETQFDYESLGKIRRGDDRLRAFGVLLHEQVGLVYYRYRGWIR